MIELFHHPRCPFVHRTVVCLLEKGLQYEIVPVDFENKPQRLLDLNPRGKVPLLVDGNAAIYESNIINQYLDEAYPDPPLLPSTPAGRAVARLWLKFSDSQLAGSLLRIYFAASETERAAGQAALDEQCRRLNSALHGRDYLAGAFSLADIACLPFVARFRWLAAKYGYERPVGLDHLEAWIERLSRRPSYVATDPHDLLMADSS